MWYYLSDGQQQGPLDDAGMDQLIAGGSVTGETLVWKEGMSDWAPLKQARPMTASKPGPVTKLTPAMLASEGEAVVSIGGQTKEERVKALNAKLLREQNLPMGILAGAGAAVVGSLIWVGITVSTGYVIGYVALAIGAGVGYAIRYVGKGVTKPFGVAGAILTLLSCVAGELLTSGSLVETNPIIYLIYGIGIYEGYKFSFRKLTPEELKEAGLA